MLNSIGLQNPGVDAVLEKYAPLWAGLADAGHRQRRRRVDRGLRRGRPAARRRPRRRRHRAQHQLPERRQGRAPVRHRRAAPPAPSPPRSAGRPTCRSSSSSPRTSPTSGPSPGPSPTPAPTRSPRSTRCPGWPSPADRRRPLLGNVYGGLSGPAIKPVALRSSTRSRQVVDIPVVAIGGVTELDDVLDFLAVGAVAVQVGTALFADPALPVRLVGRAGRELRRARPRLVPAAHRDGPAAQARDALGQGRRVPAVTTVRPRSTWPPEPPSRSGRKSCSAAPAPSPTAISSSRAAATRSATSRSSSSSRTRPRRASCARSGRPPIATATVGRASTWWPARRPAASSSPSRRAASSASGRSSPRRSRPRTGASHREFRRGFRIEPGERVLLVDDILTTGGSLLAMIPAVEALGGEVVECRVLADRSGGTATLTSPTDRPGLPAVGPLDARRADLRTRPGDLPALRRRHADPRSGEHGDRRPPADARLLRGGGDGRLQLVGREDERERALDDAVLVDDEDPRLREEAPGVRHVGRLEVARWRRRPAGGCRSRTGACRARR